MRPSNLALQSKFTTPVLALTVAALWLLLHGYHGLTGDGQIYAFQAYARLHPQLATDLYLQNTSQDRFTLFSPLYAWFIGLLGLENAARLLTLLFTLWFLAAVWKLARAFTHRDMAWATVAFLLIIGGNFGGSGVFRILDPFLTARLPAEALVITALACQVRGMNRLGLGLALAALLIHPLMALPGLLLMVCLRLPLRAGIIGAIGGIFATFAIAVVAVDLPAASHVLPVMDAAWLDVVRERSQFLFLQLWSAGDWGTNALPFFYLGLMAIASPDERIRKLCAAASLVGATGLAVAFIGDQIGPVAILVQGQAWRWVWISVLVSAVLFPCVALYMGAQKEWGPLCASMLVLGWTLPGLSGIACAVVGSALWLTRRRINYRVANHLRWVSAALGITIAIWLLVKCQSIVTAPAFPPGRVPSSAAQIQNVIREVFALKVPDLLLFALIWCGLRITRSISAPIFFSAMLAALSAFILPAAFRQPRTLASPQEIRAFSDWVSVIPPTSTVLVTPSHDVGAFVWFTLERPNYLTLDQSAGVVFSRSTALEIQRRSQVLLPLRDPEWTILSHLRTRSADGGGKESTTRPLTHDTLILVCADSTLGFVISPEKAGFDPLPHTQSDGWKNWNLYDCRKVREVPSAT
jgi:hypothetical protein